MPSLSETLRNFSAIIISGGSSGIGKSFIDLAATVCPDTLICNLSRRAPSMPQMQLKLRHFACDLANISVLAGVAAAIQTTVEREAPQGRILLINNSGFGAYGHFPEPGLAEQLGMIDVNVRAVVELTGRLLPLLRVRGGAILTVASTASFQPTPGLATYGATKAFVLNWSLALGAELRGTGVTTHALCPGPTKTDFFHRAGLPAGAADDVLGQTSDQVVRTAVRMLGAGRSLVVSGWTNKVGAFFGAVLPKPLVTRVSGWVIARYRPRPNVR